MHMVMVSDHRYSTIHIMVSLSYEVNMGMGMVMMDHWGCIKWLCGCLQQINLWKKEGKKEKIVIL